MRSSSAWHGGWQTTACESARNAMWPGRNRRAKVQQSLLSVAIRAAEASRAPCARPSGSLAAVYITRYGDDAYDDEYQQFTHHPIIWKLPEGESEQPEPGLELPFTVHQIQRALDQARVCLCPGTPPTPCGRQGIKDDHCNHITCYADEGGCGVCHAVI